MTESTKSTVEAPQSVLYDNGGVSNHWDWEAVFGIVVSLSCGGTGRRRRDRETDLECEFLKRRTSSHF